MDRETYFQPIAKPQEGSRNRVAHDENDPAIGKMTASSPSAWHVQKSMAPTIVKASNIDAGPPSARALPDATKSPVPALKCLSFVLNHVAATVETHLWNPQLQSFVNAAPSILLLDPNWRFLT